MIPFENLCMVAILCLSHLNSVQFPYNFAIIYKLSIKFGNYLQIVYKVWQCLCKLLVKIDWPIVILLETNQIHTQ